MNGPAATSPQELTRLIQPFKAVAFDWEGTAVMGQEEDASEVCALLDRLRARGVPVVVITGTHVGHASRQLAPTIRGPNRHLLFVAANRGSEVYGFAQGTEPQLLWGRAATPEEDRRLTAAADAVRDRLRARGLAVDVISDNLHRKVDLIPLPQWADPPRWQIGPLLAAVEERLTRAGLEGGLREVAQMARALAREQGLDDPRVTSDGKHVEIGLADKSDSIAWLVRELGAQRGIRPGELLVVGDAFGPVGGAEGSDSAMVTEASRGAVFVSVGPEPSGLPDGVIHLGGGPARFRRLLAAIAEVHEGSRPSGEASAALGLAAERVTDPLWTVEEEGVNPSREHEMESLLAVGNGYLGTRGSLAEGALHASNPATFLAGIYETPGHPPAVPELAVAPDWTRIRLTLEGQPLALDAASVSENRRALDMKQGLSWREWRHHDPQGRVTLLRGFRLASLHDRHLLVQSLVLVPVNYSGRVRVEALLEPPRTHAAGLPLGRPHLVPAVCSDLRGAPGPAVVCYRTPGGAHTVAFAMLAGLQGPQGEPPGRFSDLHEGTLRVGWDVDAQLGAVYRLDRMVAVYTSRDTAHPASRAAEAARSAPSVEVALDAHRAAWQARWHDVEVRVEGDGPAERALRFAAYHLISAVNPEDERVSIGARTLTGESYKGHVFWDTETFILPFFAFTSPRTARALLMYRHHLLPGARRKAEALGYRGALYPWESADTGDEVTPRFMMAPDGEVVRILCGELEHHISADVAYAVWQYWRATGDDAFFARAGAEMVIETARFWASRGRVESDGAFHIRKVIGPDEYHENVDDNAYTNLMAQWNLERAEEAARWMEARHPERWAALCARIGLTAAERSEWLDLARCVYTGYDASSGLIEQFRGFFDLEPYDLEPLRAQGKRAAPLDALLGRERVQRSQIVKQADVVMALQLLWDRFPPRVREANFRYYEPRTCHGSSLSPGVHALVAARLGLLDVALAYFDQAASIDLGNNMGNAAGGVHAAALGGLWQAAVMGFAGLEATEEGLRFDPHLPSRWSRLQFPLQWRGARLWVSATRDPASIRVRQQGEGEALVSLAGGERRPLGPGGEYAARREADGWREWKEPPQTSAAS